MRIASRDSGRLWGLCCAGQREAKASLCLLTAGEPILTWAIGQGGCFGWRAFGKGSLFALCLPPWRRFWEPPQEACRVSGLTLPSEEAVGEAGCWCVCGFSNGRISKGLSGPPGLFSCPCLGAPEKAEGRLMVLSAGGCVALEAVLDTLVRPACLRWWLRDYWSGNSERGKRAVLTGSVFV